MQNEAYKAGFKEGKAGNCISSFPGAQWGPDANEFVHGHKDGLMVRAVQLRFNKQVAWEQTEFPYAAIMAAEKGWPGW